MITVFTSDCPGLPVEMIAPVLGLPESELLVIVRTIDDAPSTAPTGLDDVHQPPDGTAFTSRGMKSPDPDAPVDNVHGRAILRPTTEGNTERVNVQPTTEPTRAVRSGEASILHAMPAPIGARRSSLTPSHDGLNRQLDVPSIQNPPTSPEYQRRQQINDNAPVYTPRSEPPAGHTTASMLEALALPGESAADAVARRQREAQAQVELGPVVVYPRLGGYTSHRLD